MIGIKGEMVSLSRIDLTQVSQAGLELSEFLDHSQLDLGTADVQFADKLRFDAVLSRSINNVTVSCGVIGRVLIRCSRCLDEFQQEYNKTFTLNYFIEKDRYIVNVVEDVREEMLAGYSMKYLCKPDCKGICARCGSNMNTEKCGC